MGKYDSGDRVVLRAERETDYRSGWGLVKGPSPVNANNIKVEWHYTNGTQRTIEDCDPAQFEIKPGTTRKSSDLQKIQYKPGTSVTDYVKRIIGIETDKERLKWLRTFDNCVLPDEVRKAVDEALTVILQGSKFDEWGISDHFEKGLANSILIYGPPGTGKTMICESIAAVLDRNLMVVSSGDIQSNIPGETERNIKESFKKARNANAVLMFDECDSILADRNNVGTILAAEINCLLQEIERFDGVCVLTTNRLHALDPALQRRIIAKVELPPPSKAARVQIWQKLIPPRMPTTQLDYERLAESELTGGEIKNAILLAARKAIALNAPEVSMEHFEDCVKGVVKAKRAYEATRPQRAEGVRDVTDVVMGKDKRELIEEHRDTIRGHFMR